MIDLHALAYHSSIDLAKSKPKVVTRPRRGRYLILPALDFLMMLAVPACQAILNGGGRVHALQIFVCWLFVIGTTVVLIASQGGYRTALQSGKRPGTRLVLYTYFVASLTMLLAAEWLEGVPGISSPWSALELSLTPILLSLVRSKVLKRFVQYNAASGRGGTLIICYDRCPSALLNALAAERAGTFVTGILYLMAHTRQPLDATWPIIKDISDLADRIKLQTPDEVIFVDQPASASISAELHCALFEVLLSYPIRFCLAVDIESQFRHRLVTRSRGYKLVPFDALIDAANPTKRVFDIVGAALFLSICGPSLVLIALLVRASGPGPVIFRQTRIGAHGQPFTVLKFRTMSISTGPGFVQARQNDPRVTKIGRFLRRSSLDELLQLFNVLKGDMSLVGPRPHAADTRAAGLAFESAVRFYQVRHRVKPGITGLAQIRGQRGCTQELEALEQRIASDLEYIENWSVWLDLAIMLKTVPVFFTQRNAY